MTSNVTDNLLSDGLLRPRRLENFAVHKPFKLLELPQEVQDHVYDLYFEHSRLKIELGPFNDGDGCTNLWPDVKISGIANLNIESVCRKTRTDSLASRGRSIPRGIRLITCGSCRHIEDRTSCDCIQQCITRLSDNTKYQWIYTHVTMINFVDHVQDWDFPTDCWIRFFKSFVSVSSVHVETNVWGYFDFDRNSQEQEVSEAEVDRARSIVTAKDCRAKSIAKILKGRFGQNNYKMYCTVRMYWYREQGDLSTGLRQNQSLSVSIAKHSHHRF